MTLLLLPVLLAGAPPLPSAADYVVITPAWAVEEFGDFCTWKTRKGIRTVAVAVESVYAGWPGRDDAEKVRSFIRWSHDSLGATWFLLAGPVPVRRCASLGGDCPCDLYFADLDGDWDADHDNIFGETSDSVDLYPDVHLGRAPFEAQNEVAGICDKWLRFEQTPESGHLVKLLQVSDSTDYGPPANWTTSVLLAPVGRYQIRDSLESGFQISWHRGAGSVSELLVAGQLVLTSADAGALQNRNRLNAFLTSGSSAGDFSQDCIAARLVRNPDGGSVAALGFSGASYVAFRPESLFFRNLFAAESLRPIGRNLDRARSQRVPEARTDVYWRHTLYAWNLLGDPELPLWKNQPRTLTVDHPSQVSTGPQRFSVSVASGGSLVSSIVCLWKDDEVYARQPVIGTGVFDINPQTAGELLVTVTALDHRPYLGACGVTSGVAAPSAAKLSGPVVSGGRTLVIRSPVRTPVAVYDAAGRAERSGLVAPAGSRLEIPLPAGLHFVRLGPPPSGITRTAAIIK